MSLARTRCAGKPRTTAHLFAGLFAMLVLAGCGSTTKIVADDGNVSLPSFRMAARLDDSKQSATEPQSGHAVEFGLTKVNGSGEQTLAIGENPVILNNTTFNAPQQVNYEFDIAYADVSYRWRRFFRERSLGIELSGGYGRASVDLDVSSATDHARQKFWNNGVQGGVGLIWRMRPRTSLHGHVSGFISSADTGVTDMGRYELFLSQGLGDHVVLRAGYAKWEVNGDAGRAASDFRMTFTGPKLELGLEF